jgi:mannose-6-phosphate isomerase-like protein (cupin superfamily)
MFVKRLDDCREFTAGDDSVLREFLHPEKDEVQINYSLACAKVMAGQKTRLHKLKTSEVYYIIEGRGLMHINDETCEVGPHCVIYIPPDSVQYIENTGEGDLSFLCIVDPAWRRQDEEILDE